MQEDLRAAGNVLSATGEHWAGAKRTGDLLDDLASKALHKIFKGNNAATHHQTASHDIEHNIPMSPPSTRLAGNFVSDVDQRRLHASRWVKPNRTLSTLSFNT